jgi:hypothetical protein
MLTYLLHSYIIVIQLVKKSPEEYHLLGCDVVWFL